MTAIASIFDQSARGVFSAWDSWVELGVRFGKVGMGLDVEFGEVGVEPGVGSGKVKPAT